MSRVPPLFRNPIANMPKSQDVKDAVKEAQSKWRFTSNAKKDPESGELYLGTDEFINIIAPPTEDYVSQVPVTWPTSPEPSR